MSKPSAFGYTYATTPDASADMGTLPEYLNIDEWYNDRGSRSMLRTLINKATQGAQLYVPNLKMLGGSPTEVFNNLKLLEGKSIELHTHNPDLTTYVCDADDSDYIALKNKLYFD